ncbi:ABC-2 type transport system ATP-binding protein [Marininema mesophilum]|uniref:ABC-2 type transport system ATP-binding protein n=1 Tax=Marininema mesophilum TaxID=1048340 RepID=A0A1H3B8P5_9BACL|nr:ABC transporter ATP-binding protein [Marininema mesophilum]SDX38322.1 ABC-2 type transport system ATP-binding protein [Marininema mesophilum]
MSVFAIETKGLTKLHSKNRGCRNITLQVQKGSVFGFLGPNGAGKSTFVRTLLSLIHPTEGEGYILGHSIREIAARNRVGYLPELFRYPDWLTGRQLLDLHGDLCNLSHRVKKKRIDKLIDRVGLAGRGDEKIKGYSKGMQQRIGLASALLSDPEVIFLDEPTSALDPIGRKEVRDLICELRDAGKTVFLNSHLLSEAETICSHIGIINHGKLIVQGKKQDLSSIHSQVLITLVGKEEAWWKSAPSWLTHCEKRQREGGRTTWVVTLNHLDNVPDLVSYLAEKGLAVYQVTPQAPMLEDIFMYWVNRKGDEKV